MRTSICKKLFLPTLFAYIAFGLLIVGTHGDGKTSFEVYRGLFGGVSAGALSDNLIKIMLWILSFLPLLIILGTLFSEELSGRLYVTIIRSKSIRAWWNSWMVVGLLVAVVFSAAVFMAGFLVAIISGDVDSLKAEIAKFLCVLCINIIYNSMISVLLVVLGVWLRSLKLSAFLLLVIIMTCYVVGKFIPELNLYLIGTYSMVNRLRLTDPVYGVTSTMAIICMLVITGSAYLAGLWGAKKVIYRLSD